jgi:hypothetical protein
MHRRCRTPTNPSFALYGGRGVSVCERWFSFSDFLADVGMPPSPDMTLDRIETNGNYEPGNVRWATPKQQAANRRMRSNTTNLIEGVKWWAQRGKYRIYAPHCKHLGLSDDFFEACCVRKSYEVRNTK